MTSKMHRPIIITGANGGLANQLAKHLWNEGYLVIGTYRTKYDQIQAQFPLDLDHTEKQVARFYQIELTNEHDVDLFAKDVIEQFGAPWAVINFAGASTNAMSWNLTAQQFRQTIDDNLLSTFNVTKAFTPAMRKETNGRIINVSSVVAFSGAVGAAHYAAAKAGIIGLTKSLALELAPKNITVNALALGYFDAGLIDHLPDDMKNKVVQSTPVKRLGNHTDIHSLVSYLLKEESSFLTGQTLHLNGGFLL